MIRKLLPALCALLIAGPAFAQSILPPSVGSTLVTPTGATVASTLSNLSSRVRDPRDFGAKCDGTTDDKAAFVAWDAYAQSHGGGTLKIPDGATCYIATALTLANDGLSTPNQAPRRITGGGALQSGQGQTTYKGSTLLFGAITGVGDIVSLGLGNLEIDHVTLTSNDTTHGLPFVYITNTTLHMHDAACLGAVTPPSNNQDCIVAGGTTTTLDGSTSAAFQGYGTVIENNYANRIRRFLYGRTYFNGNTITGNTIWTQAGGVAAIEIDGSASIDVGNIITNNLIEGGNYTNAIKLSKTTENFLAGNNIYDAPSMLAGVIADSTSVDNTIIAGLAPAAHSYFSEVVAGNNIFFAQQAGERSQLRYFSAGLPGYPVQLHNVVMDGGGGGVSIVQPAAGGLGGSTLFEILRSAAEGTNPGGSLFKFNNDGSMAWGNNTSAGNITCGLSTCPSYSNNGRTWGFPGASGGAMTIDTGTGGSNLDLKAFATRFFNHSSQLCAKFNYQANGGIGPGFDYGACAASGSFAVDVSWYRSAAGVMASSGGVKTAVYTVSTLPSASTVGAGTRAAVSDADACTFAATPAHTSGTTFCPVISTGTAWIEGKADLPANDNLPVELRGQVRPLWSAYG